MRVERVEMRHSHVSGSLLHYTAAVCIGQVIILMNYSWHVPPLLLDRYPSDSSMDFTSSVAQLIFPTIEVYNL